MAESGKFDFIDEQMAALAEADLLVNLRTMLSAADGRMVVDGKKVLNFCTNNYLGLANHDDLKHAAKEAIDHWGVGPAAVRSIAGTQMLHVELEQEIARFKGVEDALFLQSGFCANQAAIPTLVGKEDCIFTDRLNHASIIDGCRLSGAKIYIYEHIDVDSAAKTIEENLPNHRRGMLITDGVFSMDGDIAPLDKLYEVADRFGVMTMVDDAHGEGVLGQGRGIVHHFELQGKIDVEVGTFSKAFGVVGGMVSGKKKIIDFIRQKARPFLFSSANTPADTAACLSAIKVLSSSDLMVRRVLENAKYLKMGLKALGFDTGTSKTPIIPIMLGEASVAKEFSSQLFEAGLFAMALGFPTVPKGQARVRVMCSAMHSMKEMEEALSIFQKVGLKMKLISR